MVWMGRAIASRQVAACFLIRWSWLLSLAVAFVALANPVASQSPRPVLTAPVEGAIGPATTDYLERLLDRAEASGAGAVVLRLDTPGGLDTSMREVIRAIIASRVPVVTYVAPGGARAASAGTYILYASHVAAMAPGTNLGAATPVQIGAPGLSPASPPEKEGESEAEKGKSPSASEAKAINDAVAYIRSLAQMRGRNADWAEAAVRDAASLEARQALAVGAVDVVAADLPDLLAQIDGRTVEVAGAAVTLRTRGAAIQEVSPDWRHQLLSAITNPNVALILMMIGVYGLIFEFMNPGALYPGVIGGICLLIALYSLAVLPVNYAGAALIALGIGLMVAEGFAPSFGVLGIGGGAAFVVGAMILMDIEAPGFGISLPLVGGLAILSLIGSLVVVRLALTSHRRRVVSGREDLIGAVGQVQDWEGLSGHVFVRSERWRAVADEPLQPGSAVRVVAMENLTLTVEAGGKRAAS